MEAQSTFQLHNLCQEAQTVLDKRKNHNDSLNDHGYRCCEQQSGLDQGK